MKRIPEGGDTFSILLSDDPHSASQERIAQIEVELPALDRAIERSIAHRDSVLAEAARINSDIERQRNQRSELAAAALYLADELGLPTPEI